MPLRFSYYNEQYVTLKDGMGTKTPIEGTRKRPIMEILILIFSLIGGTDCLVRFAPNVQYDYSFASTQIIRKVAEIKLHSQVSL